MRCICLLAPFLPDMNDAEGAFDVLAESLLGGDVIQGKLFGHRCLKVVGKAFLVDFDGDLVFKLGREAMAAWLTDHEDLNGFDPSGKGRSMKDWLQAPMAHSDHFQVWAEASMAFARDTA